MKHLNEQPHRLSCTYLIFFDLRKGMKILTRGKKSFKLVPGAYVYVGSAKKGLGSRISRHFAPSKRAFWNVDYLTLRAAPAFCLALSPQYSEVLVARLLSMAFQGVEGFGASDDTLNSSHLFYCPCDLGTFLDRLADALIS